MNKQALNEHLTSLRQQYEQALANANAVHGAIQECTYWLAKIENEEVQVALPQVEVTDGN